MKHSKYLSLNKTIQVVFQEKSNTIENELREKVKIERDAEIERAVNRIETEMERTGVIKNRDFKNCDSRIYSKISAQLEIFIQI